jgi:hypothetical protein
VNVRLVLYYVLCLKYLYGEKECETQNPEKNVLLSKFTDGFSLNLVFAVYSVTKFSPNRTTRLKRKHIILN